MLRDVDLGRWTGRSFAEIQEIEPDGIVAWTSQSDAAQADAIRKRRAEGLGPAKIARQLGVARSSFYRVCWKRRCHEGHRPRPQQRPVGQVT